MKEEALIRALSPARAPLEGGGILGLLERNWPRLLCAAAIGAVAGAGYSYLLPSWYEANAKLAIIPVGDPTTNFGVNVIDGANATLPIVVAVLRSRVVADEAVARLGLQAAYGAHTPDQARAQLLSHLVVTTDRKANLVQIAVEDRTPAGAQAVARTVAELAADRASELWLADSRAQQRRLEAELAEVTAQLGAAEGAMQLFRERTGVVDLPAQIKASVEQAAALERLRTDKELALRYARGFGDRDAVEVRRAEKERDAATRELERLRRDGAPPLLALTGLPALEVEHARHKREIDGRMARHDLLSLKLSQLQAAQSRPGGRAELVDPPDEPRGRSRPSRTALGAQGAAAAALAAALWVVWAERRRQRSAT